MPQMCNAQFSFSDAPASIQRAQYMTTTQKTTCRHAQRLCAFSLRCVQCRSACSCARQSNQTLKNRQVNLQHHRALHQKDASLACTRRLPASCSSQSLLAVPIVQMHLHALLLSSGRLPGVLLLFLQPAHCCSNWSSTGVYHVLECRVCLFVCCCCCCCSRSNLGKVLYALCPAVTSAWRHMHAEQQHHLSSTHTYYSI